MKKTLILILVLLFVFTACSNETTNKNTLLINKVLYPEQPAYPNEQEYFGKNGNFDDEGFTKVYNTWRDARDKISKSGEAYQGDYTEFFAKSSSTILNTKEDVSIYSPMTMYHALSILAESTNGETQNQVLSLLHNNSIEENRENAKLIWQANYSADGAFNSNVANSLWLNKNIPFVQETVDAIGENYYAEIYQGEMGSGELNEEVKNWLNRQTKDQLQEAVNDVETDPDTLMTIFSTMYLQAKWQNEFWEDNTMPRTFHGYKKDAEIVFMNSSDNDIYFFSDDFGAIQKPLESGGSMWFILPDEDKSVNDVLKSEDIYQLTSAKWDELNEWENRKDLLVNLSIPKFDVSNSAELSEQLQKLGITDAFNPDKADFSNIVDKEQIAFLSAVNQANRVAIDEEGVTAASFTEMQTAGAAMPIEEEIDFVLNRPFIFVINGVTDFPLFIGVINQL